MFNVSRKVLYASNDNPDHDITFKLMASLPADLELIVILKSWSCAKRFETTALGCNA